MQYINKITLFTIFLLALLSSFLIFYSTRWGPWAGSDSAVYIATAQNVASGVGFKITRPSGEAATLIAPIYPLILAGFVKLGVPILTAARWLNIILFGLFIFFVGISILILSDSRWIAIPAMIMILIFPVILDLYSGIMTEPLFLAATVGGLLMIVLYLESQNRGHLIIAAILCGIATITRFIGIALLPVGILSVLVIYVASWKRKVIDMLLFAGAFFATILPWNIWYLFHQDTSSLLERPSWANAWEYLQPVRAGLVNVLWDWIPFHAALPIQRYIGKVVVLGLVAMSFFLLTAWSVRRVYRRNKSRLFAVGDFRIIGVMFLFLVCFLVIFIFIYLFRNPPQDIDERTLLPLYPPLILAVFSLVALLYRASEKAYFRISLIALAGLLCLIGIFSYGPISRALLVQYHESGSGYTAKAWRASPTIQALKSLDPDTIIISNDTGAILFFTGKLGLEVKEVHAAQAVSKLTRFGDDSADETQTIFRDKGAALVLFQPAFYWHMRNLYQDRTEERISEFTKDLVVHGEFPDGVIYFYPSQK
jgi:4-amino-4-deoxy-L-arabinose transferase-like glycosyltransferase